MPKPKADKPNRAQRRQQTKQQRGPRLLNPSQRARLEARAADASLIAMALARLRLRTDQNRRRAAAARAARVCGGPATVTITDNGAAGPGGGRWRAIGRPVEYRGTTAQVAGLWPWCVGAGAPLLGTPLGPHLETGEPVCFDEMTWFTEGYLTAPSLFVLGLNGFGKSSLVRRLILGGIAQGVTPLVLADVKPDYRATIAAVGGQVIDAGYGYGTINPLDAGVMGQALLRLDNNGLTEAAAGLRAELRARQTTLVAALVELVRGARIEDFEDTLIATALRLLYAPTEEGGRGFTVVTPPTLEDLAEVITDGGDELALDAVADSPDEYRQATIKLRRSLRALTQGPFGQVFNGQTSVPIDFDSVGVCIDVSHIPQGDKRLKIAIMLTTWSAGFGAVEALNLLAEVGLSKQRYFRIVLDELWQVLGLGGFMVDRVDEITRLQRAYAVALIMVSHSQRDLQGLSADAANRAMGFLERARAKILGALPAQELAALDGAVKLTATEQQMVPSWSASQSLIGEQTTRRRHTADGDDARPERPPAPGIGKFLLKISEDRTPGVPFQLIFSDAERAAGIHATSSRFDTFGEDDSGHEVRAS